MEPPGSFISTSYALVMPQAGRLGKDKSLAGPGRWREMGDYLVSAAPDSQRHGSLDVEQLDLDTGLYDVVGER